MLYGKISFKMWLVKKGILNVEVKGLCLAVVWLKSTRIAETENKSYQ